MKKFFCTFTFVFLFLNSILFASNSLQVIKTTTGGSYTGTIERCAFIIKPLGMYAQVCLDIEYSAKNTYYYKDTTEIFHSFDLPNNALVTDSWLWIGDTIMKACLIDKWKAGLIYEGIVKRRRDPSILYKKTATNYEFRIYPTPPNSSRHARIKFLLPMTFSNGTSSISLPINIIKNISYSVFNADIFIEDNNEFGVPSLNSVQMDKYYKNSSLYGPGYLYQVGSSNLSNYTIEFNSNSFKDYYFLNAPTNEKEGYYMFAFSPRKMVDLNIGRKVAILLDYDALKTSLSTNVFLELIKNSALKNLTEKDSFNIILSNINIKRARQNWVVAHPDSIYAVFESIKPDDLAKYSCLKNLIFDGISFVNSNNGGIIFLASSDDAIGSNVVANPFIEDIYKTFDNKIPPFYIADYSKKSITYYISNVAYYGNQYLYQFLSKNTKGSYIRINQEQEDVKFFNLALEETLGQIQAINWRIETKDGFTFANYNNGDETSTIFSVGKYIGANPFKLFVTGFYNGEILKREFEITPKQDTTNYIKQVWAGNYILALEKQQATNQTIADIIESSMKNRVLSLYTAFLALEPGMNVDTTGKDDDKPAGIAWTSSDTREIKATAYPNPFIDQTTISFTIDELLDPNELSVKIIDVLGNTVKTLQIDQYSNNGKYSITWDGVNDLGNKMPNGVYFVCINHSKAKRLISIILNS